MSTDSLASETHGSGVPVVFLHGLTFDRTSWRPIAALLGDRVTSVLIDLPAHGMSGGEPAMLDEVAGAVNATLTDLGVQRPIVVGHSMSAGIAMIHAARFPTRGVVDVDNRVDIRPFAELLRRLEPALRGDDFAGAFAPFQQSMGFDRLDGATRADLLAHQDLRQELVVGYWEEVFQTEPAALQARIADTMSSVGVPFLGVFGQQLAPGDRDYLLEHLPGAQLEEWPDRGHFVHLAEPQRFAARLLAFVDHCTAGETARGTAVR
jgi:pimeloyl-ACP methyl ester carboxylesterase